MKIKKVQYRLKGSLFSVSPFSCYSVLNTPMFNTISEAKDFYTENAHRDDLYKWSRFKTIVVAKEILIEDEYLLTLKENET